MPRLAKLMLRWWPSFHRTVDLVGGRCRPHHVEHRRSELLGGVLLCGGWYPHPRRFPRRPRADSGWRSFRRRLPVVRGLLFE
jgi:hypothetical protein